MKYPESYLRSHDIDWFCVANGVYIHFASAGGDIPNQINDVERLRKVQNQVASLPDIYSNEEIVYNEIAITNAIGPNGAKERDSYIESFTAMARKGFASFDRTNLGDLEDNRYHLVCQPKSFERKPHGVELYTVATDISFEDWTKAEHLEFLEEFLKKNKDSNDNQPNG